MSGLCCKCITGQARAIYHLYTPIIRVQAAPLGVWYKQQPFFNIKMGESILFVY